MGGKTRDGNWRESELNQKRGKRGGWTEMGFKFSEISHAFFVLL